MTTQSGYVGKATINIRVSKAEKKRLREVAAMAGATLSSFLRSAATTEARRVLDWEKQRAKP